MHMHSMGWDKVQETDSIFISQLLNIRASLPEHFGNNSIHSTEKLGKEEKVKNEVRGGGRKKKNEEKKSGLMISR